MNYEENCFDQKKTMRGLIALSLDCKFVIDMIINVSYTGDIRRHR